MNLEGCVTGTTISFRSAQKEDAEPIANVFLTSRKKFLSFAPLAHSDAEIRNWIAEILIPDQPVSVAIMDKDIVGIIGVSNKSPDFNWIDHLYLHPEVVGLGIGSQFVEQAKQNLEPPIRLFTFQQNRGACRFFERHGFQAIEFSDGRNNEEKCPDVLYQFNPFR